MSFWRHMICNNGQINNKHIGFVPQKHNFPASHITSNTFWNIIYDVIKNWNQFYSKTEKIICQCLKWSCFHNLFLSPREKLFPSFPNQAIPKFSFLLKEEAISSAMTPCKMHYYFLVQIKDHQLVNMQEVQNVN